MADVLTALRAAVGEAHVLTAEADVQPYVTDWRGRYHGQALAVVRPGNTAEVAAVVRCCAQASVSIVPQGGNTGLCGGATPVGSNSIVLSLQRLRRIRALDADNLTLTVEAGCTLADVQQAAAQAGLLFPLSLASEGSCTIGGNLATNAGGVHVLRYGNSRDLVLGLEVVLADGQVWDGLRGLRKDNTGYDLKQLFIGAEGTLGIITAAVLKLHPAQRTRGVAWLAVPDVAAAVQLLSRLRRVAGERLTAFELIGRTSLSLVLQHIPGVRAPLAGDDHPAWSVLVELSDSDADAPLAECLETAFAEAVAEGEVADGVIATSLSQIEALWALREHISEAQKREGFSIKHDIAVPVSRIPEFLSRAGQALEAAFPGVRVVVFGHLGDGNLHYNLSQPLAGDSRVFLEATAEANRIVHDLVVELGGTLSAEHGIGQLKRAELAHYKPSLELDLMRRIKHALDPHGLLNPGKVLP